MFKELMTELTEAHRAYLSELQPVTTPLGGNPPTPHDVDWNQWRKVKERFDAADQAMLQFLRGGGEAAANLSLATPRLG